MSRFILVLVFLVIPSLGVSAPWNERNASWNVNFNPDGSDPSKYYGQLRGHPYFPSPKDWREQSVYHIMLDRFVDGNPSNNDGRYGGFDIKNVGMRHGGDFVGLARKMDYIKSLGFTTVWISPIFQNQENSYHGYGQIDFTLLDDRLGTLVEFREMIQAAHERDMYVIVDIIVNHLSDFYFFEGFREYHSKAPFRFHQGEYALFLRDQARSYADFQVSNIFDPEATYCDVYSREGQVRVDKGKGSFPESDFHHNGVLTDYLDPWNIHLGKIYNAYDDLRLGHPRVQKKIIAMTKALISSTDIDGIRVDTPMQVPLCFFKEWIPQVRAAASRLGKKNFGFFGEFYCSREVAATMVGRGKAHGDYGVPEAVIDDTYGMDGGINYMFYKKFILPSLYYGHKDSLSRGQRVLTKDFSHFDLKHPGSGETRYRMLNFFNSHDQRRLCAVEDGFKKTLLAEALIAFWPGIPLHYFGDEQGLCSYGTGLEGHGREAMMRSIAWDDHPSPLPVNPASSDNFDMTNSAFRYVQRVMSVRQAYPALQTSHKVVDRYIDPEGGPGVYAFTRGDKAAEQVLVMFNTASERRFVGGAAGVGFETGWIEGDVMVNAWDQAESYQLGPKGKSRALVLDPYEVKVFVRRQEFEPLPPAVVDTTPNYDDLVYKNWERMWFTFSEELDPGTLEKAIYFNGREITSNDYWYYPGAKMVMINTWPIDGINEVTILPKVASTAGVRMLGGFRHRFRKGSRQNVIAYPDAIRDDSLINNGELITELSSIELTHKAEGAEFMRYSWDGGRTWTAWEQYKSVDRIDIGSGHGWREVLVQYWVDGSSAYFVKDGIDFFVDDGFSIH